MSGKPGLPPAWRWGIMAIIITVLFACAWALLNPPLGAQ